jgi:hypothetical protein
MDDDEPKTLFELQRRRDQIPELREGEINGKVPQLPASSPWACDPVPPEPSIDRREDGPTVNIEEDQS